MHDGPGVRTVVFLNGCSLTCKWCHNPEARHAGNLISFNPQKCIMCTSCDSFGCGVHSFSENGHIIDRDKCKNCARCAEVCPTGALEATVKTADTSEILAEVMKDAAFYGSDGGITVSGGEPMMQPDAAAELLRLAKEAGITTAVETCGFFDPSYIDELCSAADILLYDIKDTDDERHKANTGVSNSLILDNLRRADERGAKIRLRCIMIASVNMDEAHARRLAEISASLTGFAGIDFIPYHPMGESKYAAVGMKDTFDDAKYVPTDEQLAAFKERYNNEYNKIKSARAD